MLKPPYWYNGSDRVAIDGHGCALMSMCYAGGRALHTLAVGARGARDWLVSLHSDQGDTRDRFVAGYVAKLCEGRVVECEVRDVILGGVPVSGLRIWCAWDHPVGDWPV